MCVEQCMKSTMGCFLSYETLHFSLILLLLCSRKLLVSISHGIDKKLLTDRKAHGQRIEESSAESIAITPVAVKWGFQVYQKAADNEIGHG
jgi:hypothetical protein